MSSKLELLLNKNPNLFKHFSEAVNIKEKENLIKPARKSQEDLTDILQERLDKVTTLLVEINYEFSTILKVIERRR